MDYKYIEQLLSRYFNCLTTPEEEEILRAFFAQKEVPAELARYKALFDYERTQAEPALGEDFDRKVMAAAGIDDATDKAGEAVAAQPARKVRIAHITLANRLRPLYRAAAAVAIVSLLGIGLQRSFTSQPASQPAGWDYNQSAYKDSYQEPEKAYEATMQAIKLFKKGPKTASADSTKLHHVAPEAITTDEAAQD